MDRKRFLQYLAALFVAAGFALLTLGAIAIGRSAATAGIEFSTYGPLALVGLVALASGLGVYLLAERLGPRR